MKDKTVRKLVFAALFAALSCVATMVIKIPTPIGGYIHVGDAVVLLAGFLLGPWWGAAAAGLGSALYDLLAGGYDPGQALITFVSKFAMAWVCAKVAGREKGKGTLGRDYVACLLGALTYIALYMLKTFIYKSFVTPVPADTLGAVMVSRLIPSLINGGVAVAVTPLLYQTMVPALKKSGVLNRE